MKDPSQFKAHGRRRGRGLQDHRVPAEESWGHLPGRDGDGKFHGVISFHDSPAVRAGSWRRFCGRSCGRVCPPRGVALPPRNRKMSPPAAPRPLPRPVSCPPRERVRRGLLRASSNWEALPQDASPCDWRGRSPFRKGVARGGHGGMRNLQRPEAWVATVSRTSAGFCVRKRRPLTGGKQTRRG